MKRRFVVSLVLVAVGFVAAPAAAQITQRTSAHHASPAPESTSEPAVSDADGSSYTVEFKLDPLDASLEDGNIPRITVRKPLGYGMLARPRLHFVPELLKSVEVM